jgi:hypothetical protein
VAPAGHVFTEYWDLHSVQKSVPDFWDGATLGDAEYAEISDLARHIMTVYRPEEHFYVMIGRSPTPLAAFFEVAARGSSTTVPLTGISDAIADPAKISARLEKRLKAHLRRHLPRAGALRGRRLVLIDFTGTGRSLGLSHTLIDRYARRSGLGRVTTMALVGNPENFRPPGGLKGEDGRLVRLPGRFVNLHLFPRLHTRLQMQAYDTRAKFDAFHLGTTRTRDLKVRPRFVRLRGEMRERVRTDAGLKRFLRARRNAAAGHPVRR